MSLPAIELAVRSSTLLVAAWAAAAVVQAHRGSAATRHAVWMLGFATIASLPLLTSILPPLPLPVLPAESPAPALTVIPTHAHRPAVPVAATIDYSALLYFCVAAFLIGRLALGRVLLDRIWRRAAHTNDCRAEVVKIAALLEIRRPIDVRITAEPVVPMTWGSIRPRILLPRQALAWPPERRSSVLLHELAHIARHDSLGTLMAQTVCALYWANPLAWVALRQMRLAQEEACDDVVLCNGGAATSFAHALLHSACSLRARLPAASVAIAGRTDLEKRVRSILCERNRNRISAAFVCGAAVSAAFGGAVVAAVVPVAAKVPAEVASEQAPALVALAPPRQEAPRAAALMVTAPPGTATHAVHLARSTTPMLETVVAVAERSPFDDYQNARARYDRESAQYQIDLGEYWRKSADYQLDMARYRKDLAEHRRQVEAIRQLPDGDPRKLAPPAPVAPVAPVAPTVPVVPPVPPDLNRS